MKISEEIAQHAKDLLDDELVQAVFKEMEKRHIDNFRGTHTNATAQREEAYYMLRAIDELKQQLSALAIEPRVVAFRRKRVINSETT